MKSPCYEQPKEKMTNLSKDFDENMQEVSLNILLHLKLLL